MTLLTSLGLAASFGAGLAAGVFLNEYDVVTADHIRNGTLFVAGKFKSMVKSKEESADEEITQAT